MVFPKGDGLENCAVRIALPSKVFTFRIKNEAITINPMLIIPECKCLFTKLPNTNGQREVARRPYLP